jgi:hypothetical protein
MSGKIDFAYPRRVSELNQPDYDGRMVERVALRFPAMVEEAHGARN